MRVRWGLGRQAGPGRWAGGFADRGGAQEVRGTSGGFWGEGGVATLERGREWIGFVGGGGGYQHVACLGEDDLGDDRPGGRLEDYGAAGEVGVGLGREVSLSRVGLGLVGAKLRKRVLIDGGRAQCLVPIHGGYGNRWWTEVRIGHGGPPRYPREGGGVGWARQECGGGGAWRAPSRVTLGPTCGREGWERAGVGLLGICVQVQAGSLQRKMRR
jgi:hypothetical protein